jgi:hypothetical protein
MTSSAEIKKKKIPQALPCCLESAASIVQLTGHHIPQLCIHQAMEVGRLTSYLGASQMCFVNALSIEGERGYCYIGTPSNAAALLHDLISRPGFTTIRYLWSFKNISAMK